MNAPPIPSFEPYSCPNCGLPLPEIVEFCPACGAHTDNAQRKPQWLNCLMMSVLALFMVPTGLLGACFVTAPISAFFDGTINNYVGALVFGAVGLALCATAVLCAIGIAKLKRK